MTRPLAILAFLSLILVAGAEAAAVNGGSHSTAHLSAHRLWTRNFGLNADSSPAYLPRVRLSSSRSIDLVYILTGNNGSNCSQGDPVTRAVLYAINAANGHTIWSRTTSGASRCTTAGPVADPSGRWIYAPGLDGREHRYNAATGSETRSGGWPVAITLMPDVEKMSATATLGFGRLYVTTSGFIGDQGHYEGHLVTIDLATGRSRVFNTLCSSIRHLLVTNSSSRYYCSAVTSGLFGRGEGAIDPTTHDVYIVSGNGPWNGRTNWGDSVLKLDPSGSKLIDAYTPTNQQNLAASDQDLGSTGPAILPAVKQNGHTYHLLVQGGKGPGCNSCNGVVLRLLNRDKLSGRLGLIGHLGGDLQQIATPGNCEVLTAPAVWSSKSHQNWVFYSNDCGTVGYRLIVPKRGAIRLQRMWSIGSAGTTPALRNGILYIERPNNLTAYNPATGAVLWHDGSLGDVHWEYPLVTKNRIFVTDNSGHLYAYAL
ncbi:MAG TPA: PQQ-binding-like beta-propeller repeat protein [Chloroflexota bacterium]